MALSKQIKNVKFTEARATPAWTHTLSLQNNVIDVYPAFYNDTSYDEALNGFLRQNFRGFRIKIDLDWSRSIEPDVIRDLYNDLITAFTVNQDIGFWFYPDASKIDKFNAVIDGAGYSISYDNTIGVFKPSISLLSTFIFNSIPSWLEGS